MKNKLKILINSLLTTYLILILIYFLKMNNEDVTPLIYSII